MDFKDTGRTWTMGGWDTGPLAIRVPNTAQRLDYIRYGPPHLDH